MPARNDLCATLMINYLHLHFYCVWLAMKHVCMLVKDFYPSVIDV